MLSFDLNPETGEDERLANALREGSQEAYELLVARFQQPVYNLVYRLLADPGESYDVVQEVFLKIFRNIATFRSQSSLKTWIYPSRLMRSTTTADGFTDTGGRKLFSRMKAKEARISAIRFPIGGGRHTITRSMGRSAS